MKRFCGGSDQGDWASHDDAALQQAREARPCGIGSDLFATLKGMIKKKRNRVGLR
jgi:hypothetical protein